MSFITEVKDRLVGATSLVFGTNLFIGAGAVLPTGAGPFVTLIETGGTEAARMHNSANQRPSAQVTITAQTYTNAAAMAKTVYDALGGADGLYNVTLGSTGYVYLRARQEPTDVGLDDKSRQQLKFNIEAEKQAS